MQHLLNTAARCLLSREGTGHSAQGVRQLKALRLQSALKLLQSCIAARAEGCRSCSQAPGTAALLLFDLCLGCI